LKKSEQVEEARKVSEQMQEDLEAERDAKRLKVLEEQAILEKDLPCPDYMVLQRVDGEYQLEIPEDKLEGFVPVTKPTVDRWLKEKIDEVLK